MIVIAAASALLSAEVLAHRDKPSDFVRLIHSPTTLLPLPFSVPPLSTWLHCLARPIHEPCLAQRSVRASPGQGRSLGGTGMRANQFHTGNRAQVVRTSTKMPPMMSMAPSHHRRNKDLPSAVYSLHRRGYEESADRLGDVPSAV